MTICDPKASIVYLSGRVLQLQETAHPKVDALSYHQVVAGGRGYDLFKTRTTVRGRSIGMK